MQVVGFNIATEDIKATSNKLPYLQSCQHPEKDWWHKAVVIGGNVVVVLNVFAPLELCQHTFPTLSILTGQLAARPLTDPALKHAPAGFDSVGTQTMHARVAETLDFCLRFSEYLFGLVGFILSLQM